jgi:hypothetical protein
MRPASRRRSLSSGEALHLQPIPEAVDPIVGRQTLFPHPEAMTTLGEHM